MHEPKNAAVSPTQSHPGGSGEGAGTSPPAQRSPTGSPGPTASQRVLGAQAEPYREPLILRYFRLFWDHRWLVLGGSLLPALSVALVLSLGPRRYTAAFGYERSLPQNEYNVLQQRFHSQENLDKIIGRLRERGLTRYVRQLERVRTPQSFGKRIVLDVSPAYPKRPSTADPCTSENISTVKATLLSVEIWCDSPEEVAGVGAVLTDNIESVLPLYDIRIYLKESLAQLRSDAAQIEDDRPRLSFDLQKETAKLEKFKALAQTAGETTPSGVILPLSYQIQATQSRIVDLQETLGSNAQKCDFYVQAMDLDSRLLAQVEDNLRTYSTAQQYLGFLGEQLRACQDPAVGDYLRSRIRKMENIVLASTRAGEKPVVRPVSKDVLRNSILTFVLFLMVTMFAAVLLEHRRQRRRAMISDGPLGMAD
jgi:hypothetical protein